MTEVKYHILALWLDENGVYPGEDDEMYFPPTVVVSVKWREVNNHVREESIYMNFLCGEDFEPEEYQC